MKKSIIQSSHPVKNTPQRRRFAIPTSPQLDNQDNYNGARTSFNMNNDECSSSSSSIPISTIEPENTNSIAKLSNSNSMECYSNNHQEKFFRNIAINPHTTSSVQLCNFLSSLATPPQPFTQSTTFNTPKQSKTTLDLLHTLAISFSSPENQPHKPPRIRPSPKAHHDSTPLAIFEDVQLHMSQLLLESHLNTLYLSTRPISSSNHIEMTNFILPPEGIKNNVNLSWERQDSIGPSILGRLLSPIDDKSRMNDNSASDQGPNNDQTQEFILPLSMINNAFISINALQKSVLCQDLWSDKSYIQFHLTISHYRRIFITSRTTAQKGVVTQIADYIKHFFHPKEYLLGHTIYIQLLQSLSTATYHTITEHVNLDRTKKNPTSAPPLAALAAFVNSNFIPIQNEERVLKSVREADETRSLPTENQHKSVLHDFYDFLFTLLLLGNHSGAVELCLNPFFHNTLHYQPLLYLANMIIFNFKTSNPLFVPTATTATLDKLLLQITLSLNATTLSSTPNISSTDLYYDELVALPRNPQDRFVYQSHLWKSQAFGNHVNYRLTKNNKLYYILKLISGDYHDIVPVIHSTFYQSITLANSLYQPLLLTTHQLLQNGSTTTKQQTSLPQPLSVEQSHFFQIVDEHLQSRFLSSWGWLISLIFTLYHTDTSDNPSKKREISIFDLPSTQSSDQTDYTLHTHFKPLFEMNRLLPDIYSSLFTSQGQINSYKHTIFFTVLELFGNLCSSISTYESSKHTCLDFSALWTTFLQLSTPEQQLFPLSTLGLQKQLILTSLPDNFLEALGLDKLGNFSSQHVPSKLKMSTIPSPLKRLISSIVSTERVNDESILPLLTQALESSSHQAHPKHPPTISSFLQSLNLKWFSIHFFLLFFTALADIIPQNQPPSHHVSQLIKYQFLPLDDSPVFTAQSVISQFKQVLLTYKQWQWACYITHHTIHQAHHPITPLQSMPTPSPSFPQALLDFESNVAQLELRGETNPATFNHVEDIWEILVEYISPVPHDELISLVPRGQSAETPSSPYPLPPCPDWLDMETYQTFGYYHFLLLSLGISTKNLSQYYANLKHLEAVSPQPNPLDTTMVNSNMDSSLLFNNNLLNDTVMEGTQSTTPVKLPNLADDLESVEFAHEQRSRLNIVAETVISGFQIGVEEIDGIVQLLTTLLILEQEGQSLHSVAPPLRKGGNTTPQVLNNLVDALFNPSKQSTTSDTTFSLQAFTQLQNILAPLQAYFDEHQTLNQVQFTNSLTDQWLIKYCHIPDIVITLARYLQLLPSHTARLPSSLLGSKNQLFEFLLMLKLEQQWTQHCLAYTTTPLTYSNFDSVFNQPDTHNLYTLNQMGFIQGNITQLSSFFAHLPKHHQILLSGPLTAPHMLSLLKDLTNTESMVMLNHHGQSQLPSVMGDSSSHRFNSLPPTSSLTSFDSQHQLVLSISQFLIQRYPIHTTFISTFSTYLTPLLLRLSARLQQPNPLKEDGEQDNSSATLSNSYFQDQLTHLGCLFFLPQVNHWAEHSQFIDPELYLSYIHSNINPLDHDLSTETLTQHLLELTGKLVQLTSREAIEMIFNYTEYYVLGLIHRFSSLTETVESLLAENIDEHGNLIQPEGELHLIGVVCDSLDLLLGDINFLRKVGNPAFTHILSNYSHRLIYVKGSLFQLLQ